MKVTIKKFVTIQFGDVDWSLKNSRKHFYPFKVNNRNTKKYVNYVQN